MSFAPWSDTTCFPHEAYIAISYANLRRKVDKQVWYEWLLSVLRWELCQAMSCIGQAWSFYKKYFRKGSNFFFIKNKWKIFLHYLMLTFSTEDKRLLKSCLVSEYDKTIIIQEVDNYYSSEAATFTKQATVLKMIRKCM